MGDQDCSSPTSSISHPLDAVQTLVFHPVLWKLGCGTELTNRLWCLIESLTPRQEHPPTFLLQSWDSCSPSLCPKGTYWDGFLGRAQLCSGQGQGSRADSCLPPSSWGTPGSPISLPSLAAPGDEDPSHLMGCGPSLPWLPPWLQHKCWFPQDILPRFFSHFKPQGLRWRSRVWHQQQPGTGTSTRPHISGGCICQNKGKVLPQGTGVV